MVKDRRLKIVLDGLKAGRAKVLSIDVFDTLLWRRVPEPKDVFLILGRQLKAAGHLAAHVSPIEFAELRKAAENRAREKKQAVTGYREIRLADIYDELPDFVFSPTFGRPARVAAELDLETGLLLPDREVAALMAEARALSVKVILASDTYFCAAEIEAFLKRAYGGALPVYDKLYASCEAGKPKWRDLFDAILKDLGIAAAEMVHVGDSLDADATPCRLRGIPVLHYDKWSFAPRVQTREYPQALPGRSRLLGGRGDFGLTGLRSRLFHRPPADMAPDLQFYWSYGAAHLAPVFAGFARWVVGACRAGGVGKVYGLMREGRFLNRIVGDTARRYGVALELEELWLSRRAVVRAGLYKDNPGQVPQFAVMSPGRTTDDVLAAMGLSLADLAGHVPAGFDLNQSDARVVLCRAIGAVPALLDKLVAVSARHRANLLKALAPVLAAARRERAAFLDLGYAATIQTELERILAREGEAARFAGLYLALNDKALAHAGEGVDLRGWLNQAGFQGEAGELLTRMPYLLEHACMCPEGSLSAFDDDGRPVLLDNQRDETQLKQMEALQAGIVAGIDAVHDLLGGLDETPYDDVHLKRQIVAALQASHLHPTMQEAQSIGGWNHEGKVDFAGPYKLTDLSFDAVALEYGGWPALQDIGPDQVYWPAAAFALADPFIAQAYAGGAAGGYRAEHLASGPVLGLMTIRPDKGEGFDAKADGHVHLSVNVFGRGRLETAVKPRNAVAYKRLQCRWPRVAAVAQVDRVTLAFVGDAERRTVDVTLPALAWTGAREAAPGVRILDAGGADVVIDVDPPPWPHALELTMRYKYLRLESMFGKR